MLNLFFFTKVKIQPVAKYDWEHKYYYGRLIAVSNSFLAYAIRGEIPSVLVIFQYIFHKGSNKGGLFLNKHVLPQEPTTMQ